MKKFLLIALLLVGITPAFAQIKSANLTASGLTCSMCSKSIYKALLKVSAVKDIQVDIKNSSYNITFKEDVPVVLDQLKNAVENAGFSVASLQVTAHFEKTEVANDTHVTFQGNTYHFLNVPQQTLSGDKTFTVVDKNYLSAADRRKYAKYTTMPCFESGKMAPCCSKNSTSGRVYHITM